MGGSSSHLLPLLTRSLRESLTHARVFSSGRRNIYSPWGRLRIRGEPQMHQPSREAMAGKLRIHADREGALRA
jgi:hypothetical protein